MAQVYDLIITDHGIVRDTRTYVVVGLDVCCLNSSDVIRTFTMGKLQPMVNWLSIDINIPFAFLPPPSPSPPFTSMPQNPARGPGEAL